MSKQLLKSALTLLVAFSVVTLSALHPTQAQKTEKSKQHFSRTSSVMRLTDEMFKETSKIRELPILRSIKSGTKSRTDIERMVTLESKSEDKLEEIRRQEVILKRLGLAPKDFDYRSLMIKSSGASIAGYYLPSTKSFYLADWIPIEGQKPVMAHELTHALQDQHFDLSRFEKIPKSESDYRLAFKSLIEGDAMAVMTVYRLRNPQMDMKYEMAMRKAMGTPDYELSNKIPHGLSETSYFPYKQGGEWVGRLYNRGGWNAITSAFKNPPQSTEQILHLEKYLRNEAPVKIELPDLSSMLGPDWKQIEYNVNGEWGYYQILIDFLSGTEETERAAAGWGGDRFTAYENSKHNVLFAAMTAWDSDKDAKEFYNAYSKRTDKLYGATLRVDGILPNTLEAIYWQTNTGKVILFRNASKVLILEGVPDSANAQLLIQKMWTGK